MCRKTENLNMLRVNLWVGRRIITVLDKILRRIAENPGINAYQIARISPRLDRVTVMRSIRKCRIVEQGYVRVEKGKRNARCYFITLKGILFVLYKELLSAEGDTWDHAFIREIITKYHSMLPLVFGKWDYFDKMGVGEMALCRLKAIVDDRDSFVPGHSWIPGKSMEERIHWFFYFAGILTFPQSPRLLEGWCGMENPQKWTHAWMEDEDIKAFVSKEYKDYQGRLKDYSAFVDRFITIIDGTRELKKKVGEGK
jgi:hypothetical protein